MQMNAGSRTGVLQGIAESMFTASISPGQGACASLL